MKFYNCNVSFLWKIESSSDSEYEPDEEYPEIGYASEPASVAFVSKYLLIINSSNSISLSFIV